MEHPIDRGAPGPPAPQSADTIAEERSEDDGMREHADKAADPVAWAERAARRSIQARGPVRRRRLAGESD